MTHDELLALVREHVGQELAGTFYELHMLFVLEADELLRIVNAAEAAEREACWLRAADYLHALRFSNAHLGLGDVRLTLGQQDALLDIIRARSQEPAK